MRSKIVFEDEDLIIVEKPAGIAVESAGIGQIDVVSELKNYLVRQTKNRNPYLGVVHRIDQPVEGLVAFAKNKKTADALTKQLGKGELTKVYRAVVYGKLPQKEGTLIDYMVKEGAVAKIVTGKQEDNPGQLGQGKQDAKKAVLHYRVLNETTDMSLLEIFIETGRFHQIRAQMAHAGNPLLGDQKYKTEESGQFSESNKIKNVALCAYTLEVCGKNFTAKPQNPAFKFFETND